ncbi:protein MpPKS/CHS-like3 [Marchantia polymorpha subsp. ruderalis]|nr:hypothetical protein MARPO_0058s0114 [Marchantia polymorpha]BBN12590.1 hypothetical protein Mp_5g21320 [Marchantia polymorpha subsp. ruderalis]|eukprot:PTQ37349.1 hypothetical protein MARPO_0058s0114 [Marchantia polymorpha]
MQGNWPGLPNWVFNASPPLEPGEKWSRSSSCSPRPGAGACSGSHSGSITPPAKGHVAKPFPLSSFSPSAGKAAIGGGLNAVLQAAGGLLRLLGKGGSTNFEKRRRKNQRQLKRDTGVKVGAEVTEFNAAVSTYGSNLSGRGSASVLLTRVTSVLFGRLGKMRERNALPTILAALLPPLLTYDRPSNMLLPAPKDVEVENACMVKSVEESVKVQTKMTEKLPKDGVIVEPKTGVSFPSYLLFGEPGAKVDDYSSCQVLAGVGFRSKTLIRVKSIVIYAFGLYVEPNHLRAKLGDKYAGVPPEELKYRPEFYDDLLSQGVGMTVRLVVHYKGLSMGMVRSAFESSLKLRLKRIKGVEDDEGLQDFCSLMSEDLRIFRGTTIDVRWQPGGALQTEIGGHQLGTVFSHHLCRAFFDLYIGETPVSESAKYEIGESFGRLLTNRPHV